MKCHLALTRERTSGCARSLPKPASDLKQFSHALLDGLFIPTFRPHQASVEMKVGLGEQPLPLCFESCVLEGAIHP
jgi:hypothetical protein